MSTSNYNILVVDDKPSNLHFFSKILTEKGYKVRRAISGQLALNGALDAPPDLILLDIMMPYMDGYEVCRRLKAIPETRDIPVIFLSALNEAFDKVKAFAVGGIDYVTKPFQVEEVLARVEIQLTVQQLSKLLKEQNTQLKQEINFRQQTEEKLRQKSQHLANFSYHLKQLHRLNTTRYNDFEELFTDYIQTGCNIFSFSTGIISEIVNSIYKICAVESCFDFLMPGTIFNLNDTCCAEVIDSKKTVAHAQINKIIPTLSPTVYWKPKSYFGTPIIVNGSIYGTLSFSSTKDRLKSFTSQEQELIELMAQDLGRLISNYQIQLKRKQAEKQLVLLERAISASNNGIIISNAQEIDYPIVYVNSGFEKITGYSEAEVLGKNCDFLHKDDVEQPALKELRRATTEGRECQVILRNYRKDGTLFWNEFSLTPVQDEIGQITHFIGVQTDVTKRKQTELEIETKNAALKQQMLRKLLLTQITQEIRSSLEPEQIFQTAAAEICKALDTNYAIIYTYIEHPIPKTCFASEYKQEGFNSIKDINIPVVNNPHAEMLLSQDQAIASDDVYKEPLLKPVIYLCHQIGLKSMLAVRTSYHGKPNGLICVHQYDQYRHWDDDEIELIESVAAQVGIAIAQANLLEQERLQNQQLQEEIFNRQQVENALLQSEERWQILVKGNNDAIWDLNIETGEITFTRRWAEMLGYQKDEIKNNKDEWLKCVHPDDFERLVAHNQDYLDQRIPRYSIEYRLRTKDGSYIWVLARAQAVWNEQGKAIRMVCATTNITERKLVEEKLRDSQQKLSFLVQSAPLAVIERNLNGEVVTWNQAAENIFGYTATEAISKIGVELLVPQDAKVKINGIIDSVLTKKTSRNNINENLTKSGNIILCEWYDTPLLNEHGSVIGIVSIAMDITKRMQAETALKEAKQAAEMASRAKSDFLSSMSHELRTPLNAILGFSQLLNRDDSLNMQQRENLGIINRSGEHLLALINDILSMSKIEAGQITLKENSFDLYWLLDSIQEMLKLKAQAKGLELSFERHLDIPQYVKTDESKLRQVLINLLGNAIKFTQKGRVLLRVLSISNASSFNNNGGEKDLNNQQMTIKFDVEDTGQGIAAEELSSLFAPFVQTQTGRQSMEGTGLGLPISRQFVNLMGGDIVVTSTFNQGSIFTFDIKVTRCSSTPIATTKPQMKQVIGLEENQPTYRILVVEDSTVNRLLLVKLLRPLGFEIKEAANGEEAIALWQTWQPHLIWMDIQMPIIDGYQATKAIKEMAVGHCHTVIIALTASAFEEQREAILKAGCDDFVRKPFRTDILLEKMALHLGVRYIYKQPKLPELPPPLKKLQPESLNVMPREWVANIHQLAEACQDEDILALIEQIPEEYTDIKLALTDLVDNFRLDVIFDLSERLITKSEN